VTVERTIFIVDDDDGIRDSLRAMLESAGYDVIDFASATEFLGAKEWRGSCLIADIRMPGMDGLELQQTLAQRGSRLPVIIVTGYGDVPLAIRAMKAGAVDFIEKPFDAAALLAGIGRALDAAATWQEAAEAAQLIERLTTREREVLQQLVAGRSNKLAAHALGISPRTVEIHRARIMHKLKAKTMSDLVRTAVAASKRRGVSQ
jgi:two-component system response regulator FixJ